MSYSAEVVADSISEDGVRLTTMVITFPRFVHAEFMTHRVFSRNSASSRAIPVPKQIAKAKEDPAIPIYWGKNRPGMVATEELVGEEREQAMALWLEARDRAIEIAERMVTMELHKQIPNRLLEPFMWHTVIVTATEWSNFFSLRIDPNAQPEIRRIAELMKEAMDVSEPTLVHEGQWHLPLLQDDEREWADTNQEEALKVCAGRCARVSYLTHDGRRDHSEDIRLFDMNVSNGHMSPLEHVATPVGGEQWLGNFRGWKQFRKTIENEHDFSLINKD